MPATLVQSGVLRCFCPSKCLPESFLKCLIWFSEFEAHVQPLFFNPSGHVPGLVSMQVACEGYIISNSCAFEYKKQELSLADKQNEWFGLSSEFLFIPAFFRGSTEIVTLKLMLLSFSAYHLQLHLIERFEELERRMTPLSLAPSAPQVRVPFTMLSLKSTL